MSDFLVSMSDNNVGKKLLSLLQRPYRIGAPGGRYYNFPWGSLAVLYDIIEKKNIYEDGDRVYAWLGDLVIEQKEQFFRALYNVVMGHNPTPDILNDPLFDKLNGAFVGLIADSQGFCVVTDPLSFTPVYQSCDNSKTVSVGSHPDLVSCISPKAFDLDLISVAEFLNTGTPTFPHTIYKNVFQLDAASVYFYRPNKGDGNGGIAQPTHYKYWFPPEEMPDVAVDKTALASQLGNIFLNAVEVRAQKGKAGVFLSGGLDSRLIMGSIAPSVECVGITFGDQLNLEMKTARRVARAFNRKWIPFFRDDEYLCRQMLESLRFIGCECDWIHAHSAGFYKQIQELELNALFNGAWVGFFLRGAFAGEYIRQNRLKGLLPPKYMRRELHYKDNASDFLTDSILPELVEAVKKRRSRFVDDNICSRQSLNEWYDENPITQSPEISCWAVERRMFPSRLAGADRNVLDFAFKCPVTAKIDGRLFVDAAIPVIGKAADIPDANNGVRLGSGHRYRLFQRAVRKTHDGAIKIMEQCGKKKVVWHSWHDYQDYWQNSRQLDEIRCQYGTNLDRFDGVLFKGDGRELLNNKDVCWKYGFRLLHLAIWLDIQKDYLSEWEDK